MDPDAVTAADIPLDMEDVQELPMDEGYPALTPADSEPLPGAKAFDANNVPPEILADPAVQAVISSVAADHGFDATPTVSSAPSPPTSGSGMPPGVRPTREAMPMDDDDSIEDEDDEDGDDLGATSSRSRGFNAGRPTSSASPSGIDDDDDSEEGSGMKLSTKFGWTTLAVLAAGYLATI